MHKLKLILTAPFHVRFWLILLISGILIPRPASAVVIFSDNMTNGGLWTKSSPTDPDPLTVFDNTLQKNVMALPNTVVYRDIGTTLTQDWDLNINYAVSDPQRTTIIGLFNSTGTQGYVFNWVTDAAQGVINIDRYSVSNPAGGWAAYDYSNPPATPLTSFMLAGAPSVQTWNDVKLSWVATQGANTLTLSVNGSQLQSVIDNTYTEFSRIYIRGNAYSVMNAAEITSTVPEPAALPMVLLAAGLFFILRKARARDLAQRSA